MEKTRVDSLSAVGCFLRLSHDVGKGARLFVVVWLTSGARVALRCTVQRVEALPDGENGVGLTITRYRML